MSSVPGSAAGASGRRTALVAPSSRVPKWTSIMKNVMSCSTTSSSAVRLGFRTLELRVGGCDMSIRWSVVSCQWSLMHASV